MTTAADDATVEDAFEAVLAGRSVPDEGAGLSAFTEAVRMTATSPGRPNAALAELLATGLLVDQSSPSARTARSAEASPSRGARVRVRRRFAMFFPALLAKILSAGAVAQAATGATVVVVAFAGAGVAGVLPGPVQETFTSVVSDETDHTPVVEEPVTEPEPVEEPLTGEATTEDDGTEEDEAGTQATPTPEEVVASWMEQPIQESFGAWVSAARHDTDLMAAIAATGENFGHYVSRRAQDRGMTQQDLADQGVFLDELSEDVVVEETPEADAPVVAESPRTAPEPGTRGNGNGRGNGGGNGGNGNGRN